MQAKEFAEIRADDEVLVKLCDSEGWRTLTKYVREAQEFKKQEIIQIVDNIVRGNSVELQAQLVEARVYVQVLERMLDIPVQIRRLVSDTKQKLAEHGDVIFEEGEPTPLRPRKGHRNAKQQE